MTKYLFIVVMLVCLSWVSLSAQEGQIGRADSEDIPPLPEENDLPTEEDLPPLPGMEDEGEEAKQGGGDMLKDLEKAYELAKNVKNDLGEKKIDEKVQSSQQEIVDMLHKIIEENRPKKSSSSESSQSEGGEGGGPP